MNIIISKVKSFLSEYKTPITLSLIFLFVMSIVLLPAILFSRDTYVYCVDGDTFKRGGTIYRLSYIDTPEVNEEGAYKAEQYACNYLRYYDYTTKKHGKDTYGRTLVEVFIGDKSLNELLIEECLAEPFWTNTTDKIKDLYRKNCNNGIKQ